MAFGERFQSPLVGYLIPVIPRGYYGKTVQLRGLSGLHFIAKIEAQNT